MMGGIEESQKDHNAAAGSRFDFLTSGRGAVGLFCCMGLLFAMTGCTDEDGPMKTTQTPYTSQNSSTNTPSEESKEDEVSSEEKSTVEESPDVAANGYETATNEKGNEETDPAVDDSVAEPEEGASIPALAVIGEFNLINQPLKDVLGFISASHSVPITLDEPALNEAGIATDTPVTYAASGKKLAVMLKELLKPLGLTYTVEGKGLKVTPIQKSSK
jgi:hypothetical protein